MNRAGRWVLLVLVTIVIAHVYLVGNFPFTHDGENHLARMANYKLAVRQGQFPPRWAPNLDHHFGYPVFNFNYPLANILSLPLSFIKVPYEIIFRLLVVGSMASLVLGCWFLLPSWGVKGNQKMLALLALASSPVLASLLAFRGSLGEILALGIFPWLIYVSIRVVRPAKISWSSIEVFASICLWAAFFLSHNITVLYGTPLALLGVLLAEQVDRRKLARLLPVGLVAIALTLWFWLPALVEKSFVVLEGASLSQQVSDHLLTGSQLWFSPNQFGFSYPGPVDSAALGFGAVFLLSIVAVICWAVVQSIQGRKITDRRVIFAILVAGLLLLETTVSALLWKLLPLVNFIQFPWRISILATLFVLPVVTYCWEKAPKFGKWLVVLGIALQLLIVLRTQPVDRFHKINASYEEFPQTTSTGNENLPKDFTFNDLASWQVGPVWLSASGSANVSTWNGTRHEYDLTVTAGGTIVEQTANFPGWQTHKNGQELLPYLQSPEVGGRVAYHLDPGSYHITTRFTQSTMPRIIGNTVSLITVLTFGVGAVYVWRKNHS